MANVPNHGLRLTSAKPPDPGIVPDCDEHRLADLFGRFWDGTVGSDETERQIGVIERALRLAPGDHVLVFPAGACRLALALATRGYSVTGIDNCPDALERAAMLAGATGSAFRSIGHDERADLPPGAAAICLGWPGPAIDLAAWLATALADNGRALVEICPSVTHDGLTQALSEAGLATLGDCPDFWDEVGVAPRRVIVAVRS